MIIHTCVSFKQYVKLIFGLTYRKPMMIFLMALTVALIVWIVGYNTGWLDLPAPVIYQYLMLVLIAVVQPLVIFITIWRNYYSSNHLRETLKMEFTPDQIKITGESFYMEMFWNRVFKIVEQAHWFLVYQNNLSAIIIHKKDFGKGEINDFRSILKGITGVTLSLKH